MNGGIHTLKTRTAASRTSGGSTNQKFISPFVIPSGISPNDIECICRNTPANTIAIHGKKNTIAQRAFSIPAAAIKNLVKNKPKGGTPIIASNPAINVTLMKGAAATLPLTFLILLELYFRKRFPADKNRDDFTSA